MDTQAGKEMIAPRAQLRMQAERLETAHDLVDKTIRREAIVRGDESPDVSEV